MEKITRNPDGSKLIHCYEPLLERCRSQDPSGDGAGLTFETIDRGEYPDMMPRAVRIVER
jgi:hypothetical protein